MRIKSFFICCAVIFLLYSCSDNSPKIVFVDSKRIYSEFTLTLELNNKMQELFHDRNVQLDSMEMKLRGISSQLELNREDKALEEQFHLKRNELIYLQDQLMEETEAANQQFTEQIANRINQYMSDFGKEKGYSIILGANGDGGIMYAENTYEVTDQALEYINERYNGVQSAQ